MSSGWIVRTFDRGQWDQVFGGGLPGVEQKIVDAFFWDHEGYFAEHPLPGPHRDQILASKRGRQAKALAFHLVRDGFTYDGLDVPHSALLDEFACNVFDEEALGDDLKTEWHSPDHVSVAMVEELLYRTGNIPSLPAKAGELMGHQVPRTPARLLPLLLTGRRFGTEATPTKAAHSFYVIFSPAEVIALKDEVSMAINAPIPWRYAKAYTEKYLATPLSEAIASGRWTAMDCRF